MRRAAVRLAPLALLLALMTSPVASSAQGTCRFNGAGTCAVTGDVTSSISIVVSRAVLMSLSSSGIALDPPAPAAFDAGFGETVGPTVSLRANTTWSLSVHTTQALWTGSGPTARADKPATDLQWGLVAGGTFTDVTTTDATIQVGTATAGTDLPLYFRVKYAWLLDTPGNYSIPVQLTITAP